MCLVSVFKFSMSSTHFDFMETFKAKVSGKDAWERVARVEPSVGVLLVVSYSCVVSVSLALHSYTSQLLLLPLVCHAGCCQNYLCGKSLIQSLPQLNPFLGSLLTYRTKPRSFAWDPRPWFMVLPCCFFPLSGGPSDLQISGFFSVCLEVLLFPLPGTHFFPHYPIRFGMFWKVDRSSSQVFLCLKCFPWSLSHLSEKVNSLLLHLWIHLLYLYYCAFSAVLWCVSVSSSLPDPGFL